MEAEAETEAEAVEAVEAVEAAWKSTASIIYSNQYYKVFLFVRLLSSLSYRMLSKMLTLDAHNSNVWSLTAPQRQLSFPTCPGS